MAWEPAAHTDTPHPAPLPAGLEGLDPASENPRMPVDGGLAALGLVGLAAASVGIVGAIYLFVSSATLGLGGMRGGILPMLGIFAASLVRSGYHLGFARAATKRRPDVRDAARRYLVVSAIHTALVLAIVTFVWLGGPSSGALPAIVALVLFLMSWPVTVWALVTRRLVTRTFGAADTFDVALVPADRGVGAAGVLMTMFGVLFLFIDLGVLALLVASEVPLRGAWILLYVTIALLAARSVLHIGWGLRALRGRLDFPGFRAATLTYLWVSAITVLAALGTMFAMPELRLAFSRAPFNMIFVAVVIATALLAWPSALRAYAQDAVPFWDAEFDAERPFRPAVDRGLTALGYLHIWFAVFGLAGWFAGLLGIGALGVLPGLGDADGAGVVDHLLGLVGLGLQLWVALELIGMTARYQLAAAVYAGVAVVLTIVQMFVLRDAFAALEAAGPLPTIVLVMSAGTSLVLPTMTFVLSRGKPPVTLS